MAVYCSKLGRIPHYTYKFLSYIETTGTQYINTGFYPNQNTRVIVDIDISQSSEQQSIFGARSGNTYFELFTYNDGDGYQDDYGNTQIYPVGSTNYGRHTLDKNKNEFFVDGNLINTITATTFSISYPLFLLAVNKDGAAYSSFPLTAKLYSAQIYDNDTLIRDYVPVKRYSDEVYGLYDKKNNVFYSNAGSGVFEGGVTE